MKKLKLQAIDRIPSHQQGVSSGAVLATKHLPTIPDINNRRNRKSVKLELLRIVRQSVDKSKRRPQFNDVCRQLLANRTKRIAIRDLVDSGYCVVVDRCVGVLAVKSIQDGTPRLRH